MRARTFGFVVLGAGLWIAGALLLRESWRPSAPPLAGAAAVTPGGVASAARDALVEPVWEGRFGPGWEDWGYGPHETTPEGRLRVQLAGFGGLLLHHAPLESNHGELRVRFRVDAAHRELLEVAAARPGTGAEAAPRVALAGARLVELAGGALEARVPVAELLPGRGPFDRVLLRARRHVRDAWVEFEEIGFTGASGAAPSPPSRPARAVTVGVRCDAATRPIDPRIYGVSNESWESGAAARRLGGNPTSRLDWEAGNWNTGSDWYFENVHVAPGIDHWIEDARRHQGRITLVAPALGWVARDGVSSGFPRARHGEQQQHDPHRPEAGNGIARDGRPLGAGPRATTSRPAPPEEVARWVAGAIARDRASGQPAVDGVILDNEPTLWHVTHRDVHPEPVGYDELRDRTLRYATAIRRVAPDLPIAGPAAWGYSALFFSARDLALGATLRPDRRAHGDVPLLEWLLGEVAAEERRTGLRLLDLVDVHFYPQAEGVYSERAEPEIAALRVRSTRALWDPSYRDESWIGEHVRLLPRLAEIVERALPGRGISIGEWSFGGERHPSGGVAVAEALGRFGAMGVASAYFWGALAPGTSSFHAFRAYRNFDGRGARFGDLSLPAVGDGELSAFASRDADGRRLVLVLVNRSPVEPVEVRLALGGCAAVAGRRAFEHGTEAPGLDARAGAPGDVERVPPHSLRVVELRLGAPE